ncbi:MAG TPA: 6-phosphofructokinase [Acidobacteriota bacterium]|nr:6-phosphofructokinase [Acidobacteriota bacterium]HRR55809.1 6-phosphofructokinase [Acidobacteriota bacterium]HRV07450.1 6-phosphofructokinase [Acidobacteriota bacterium]
MGKRIGILTGGGDVPGLNPCIRAIVNRAMDDGDEVVGIRRGWGGLLNINPDDKSTVEKNSIELRREIVRTVGRTGGTFLHTSRVNPGRVSRDEIPAFLRSSPEALSGRERIDFTDHILKVLDLLQLDALIPIGGDDTLSYALRMHKEGVRIIAVPKTMDNDVFGTDYCIGFSTAVTRSVEFITQLRTSMGSHERIGVVELFGRKSGETSLMSAYLAEVDRAVITEVPFDPERLAELLAEDQDRSPSHYSVVTVSEGARMIGDEAPSRVSSGRYRFGGIGAVIAEEIYRRTHRSAIYQQLGYLMRSGVPDSLDRMVSTNYGSLAIDLLQHGLSGRMVILREGRYGHEDIEIISQGVKRVDVDTFYDIEFYVPKVTSVLGKPMFLY